MANYTAQVIVTQVTAVMAAMKYAVLNGRNPTVATRNYKAQIFNKRPRIRA